MPEIVVIDPTHVTIDGVSAGSVTDVLANHDPGVTLNPDVEDSGLRSALLSALIARDDAIRQAHAGVLEALSSSHTDALAKLQSEHAETLAQRDAQITAERERATATLRESLTSADAKHAAAMAAAEAKHEKALAERMERIKAIQAARHADHTKECANLQSKLAAMTAKGKENQELIAALGGTELGQKMKRDAARQAALDRKAAAEAELAELEAAP